MNETVSSSNPNKKVGVLLVEFGTSEAPTRKAVFEFISNLMTAESTVEPFFRRIFYTKIFPWLIYKPVTEQYKHIWLEGGSPLYVYSKKVEKGLQEALGSDYIVRLGLVLNKNSISNAMESLSKEDLSQLIIIPHFPHYSPFNKISQVMIMDELKKFKIIPDITMLSSLKNHPYFIATICELGKKYNPSSYDHVIFCYHSLPMNREKKILDAYSNGCHETSELIAEQLQISKERYTTCFQSREGKEPWLEPYTEDILPKLAAQGKKKILAFCPSWLEDCLETLYEVGVDYTELYKEAGGETLDLVTCIDGNPMWINSLKDIVLEHVNESPKHLAKV